MHTHVSENKIKPSKPGLYVAATPIGNLEDITIRVIETLKSCDLILCEDTRHTAKLCEAYGIKTPRQAYHDHNGARVRPTILAKLREGASIILVTDAGTPLVSDPGYKLVRDAIENDIDVIPLPGPCAAIAALSAAGMPSDQFFFAGFPPAKELAREKWLADLASIAATLVIYESANRLGATLHALHKTFGARACVVAREITKRFETFHRGTFAQLAEDFTKTPAKGEIVLLVHPPSADANDAVDLDAFLKNALETASVREAAADAAAMLGIPKKRAYERALALSGKK